MLAAALEREHQEIDRSIEEFLHASDASPGRSQSLRRAIAALRRHIFLEEEFLFEPLREAGLVAPIFVMLREHGEIWETMDAIEAQLHDEPERGPGEEICRRLLGQLDRHNSKEEAIVYPQAGSVLSAEADATLREFLDGGTMPEGWVCRQAPGPLWGMKRSEAPGPSGGAAA